MSLTLERVTVSEGNAFNLDVADGETVLLFNEDNRSFDAQRAGSANTLMLLGGSAIFEYGPGSYTLKPMYRYPLTLYIARISNAPAEAQDVASTPAAESASPVTQQATAEELVRFLADPASSPIGKPEEWNESTFEIGHIEPGDSYEASLHASTCCLPGLAVFHVIGGTMNIELSGQANVIRAGQDPATLEIYEPSTEITLGLGDTIWFGIEARPVVTNPGSDQLSFLNLATYFDPEPGNPSGHSGVPPGYTRASVIYTSNEIPMYPGTVSTALERIELNPEETFTLTASENQRQVALIGQGVIQYHKDTGDKPVPPSLIHSRGQGYGIAFHTLTSGDYIIENNEDEPATLYVLTITTVPD
jgi:hypothetical protein